MGSSRRLFRRPPALSCRPGVSDSFVCVGALDEIGVIIVEICAYLNGDTTREKGQRHVLGRTRRCKGHQTG